MTSFLRFLVIAMTIAFAAVACSPEETGSNQPSDKQNNQSQDADSPDVLPEDTSPSQEGCGAITRDGECFGNTAMWCDFGIHLKSQSCSNSGGTGCQDGACRGIPFGFPCDLSRNLCANGLECRKGTCSTAAPGTLVVDVVGWGTVTSTSSELDCSDSCLLREPGGTTVSLSATPDPNWKFSSWSGDCHGQSETVQVDVASNETKKCTANFEQTHSTVYVAVVSGQGRIQSNPAGLDCTTDCSTSFEVGQRVTLTATPDPGFEFEGWLGVSPLPANAPAEISVIIAPVAYHEYYPMFRTLINYSLEVTGPGRVLSKTPNFDIDCPGTCNAILLPNERYDLIAIPDAGAQFVKWDGDEHCHLSHNTGYTLEFSDSRDDPPRALRCTAVFEEIPPPPTFEVTVQVTGAGRVTSEPAGIDCPGASCSASFVESFYRVELRAWPAPNSVFLGWTNLTSATSSNCTGMSPTIWLNFDSVLECHAQFSSSLDVTTAWSHYPPPHFVQSLRFTPDGAELVMFTPSSRIRIPAAHGTYNYGSSYGGMSEFSSHLLAWNLQKDWLAAAGIYQQANNTPQYELHLRPAARIGRRITSQNPITALAWDPTETVIASATDNGSIYLWNGANGALIEDWPAHNAAISTLSWSPDGNYIASSSSDSTKIWSAATSTLLNEFTGPGWDPLDWSHDSTKIAGTTPDHLHVWSPDGTSGASWPATACESISFNPGNTKLVAACQTKLTVWDIATQTLLRTDPPYETTSVTTVRWNPIHDQIVASYDDHTLRRLDGATGELRYLHRGPTQRISELAHNPHTKTLYAASLDGFVYALDALTGAYLHDFHIPKRTQSIESLVLSLSGDTLIGASGNHVYEWSARTGAEVSSWNAGAPITQIALSENDVLATSLAATNGIRLWPTPGQPHSTTLSSTQISPKIAWQPGGHLLASTSPGTTHIWNTQTNNIEHTLTCPAPGSAFNASFSTDGQRIVTVCEKDIRIWDVATGTLLKTISISYPEHIAWRPGTEMIAVSKFLGSSVQFYDTATGKALLADELRNRSSSLTWTADGQQLFLGSISGATIAFDVIP